MRGETLIKLKKIVSTHDRLRQAETIGHLLNPIVIGQPIVIIGDVLDPDLGDYRFLRTTAVQKIDGNRYHTKNSVYEITEIGKANDQNN